ncbi:MAG TPA: hypothetical protein VD994_20080 [Prosthecobacter sp.]|nr:hypothetical protein [Prosthecobacter sp.]
MKSESCYVVVEGSADAAALRRLLPTAVRRKCDFVIAKGKPAAVSDARTLLILSQEPVVVVLDADTLDVRQTEEEKSRIKGLLASVSRGAEFDVFFAVPNLDAVATDGRPVNHKPLVRDLVSFVETATR